MTLVLIVKNLVLEGLKSSQNRGHSQVPGSNIVNCLGCQKIPPAIEPKSPCLVVNVFKKGCLVLPHRNRHQLLILPKSG